MSVLILQITANILLFVFVHLVGIFVLDKTEHAQRKVFSEARSCIAARIEAEDENDKLVCCYCYYCHAVNIHTCIQNVSRKSDCNPIKGFVFAAKMTCMPPFRM